MMNQTELSEVMYITSLITDVWMLDW